MLLYFDKNQKLKIFLVQINLLINQLINNKKIQEIIVSSKYKYIFKYFLKF